MVQGLTAPTRKVRPPLGRHRDTGEVMGGPYVRLSSYSPDTSETDPGGSAKTANSAIILQAVADACANRWVLVADVPQMWHNAVHAGSIDLAVLDENLAAYTFGDGLRLMFNTPALDLDGDGGMRSLPRFIGDDGTATPACAWQLTGDFQIWGMRWEKNFTGTRDQSPQTRNRGLMIIDGRNYLLQDCEVYRSVSSGITEQASDYYNLSSATVSTGGRVKGCTVSATLADAFYTGNGARNKEISHCTVTSCGDDYFPMFQNTNAKAVADNTIIDCYGRGQTLSGRGVGICAGERNTWRRVTIHGTVGIGILVEAETSGGHSVTDAVVDDCLVDHPVGNGIEVFGGTGRLVSGISITSNVLVRPARAGYIRRRMDDVLVDGNVFVAPTNVDGMLLLDTHNLTITNNLFDSPPGTGINHDGQSSGDESSGVLVISGNSFTNMQATYRPILLDSYAAGAAITIGAGNTATGSPAEFLRANYTQTTVSSFVKSQCLLNGVPVTSQYTVQGEGMQWIVT